MFIKLYITLQLFSSYPMCKVIALAETSCYVMSEEYG